MDPTEEVRRQIVELINKNPKTREEIAEIFGQVWDVKELLEDFTVESFLAPVVIVTRKSDGKRGMLMFQHNPRYYFKFDLI